MNDSIRFNIKIINQLYEIERKASQKAEMHSIQRNIDRIKNMYEETGLFIHDPLGESYNETRTDCEAEIGGDAVQNLFISNVIKPIIYQKAGNSKNIIQRAVVIVESKT